MPKIDFHSEEITFKLRNKAKLRVWLAQVVDNAGGSIAFIQYVFCNDAYLVTVNQEYLQHDTLTDIITFNYQEHPQPLESDIYISVERVRENALHFSVPFEQELYRVMIHGILHLLGMKDKSTAQKKQMRVAEDQSLALLQL